MRTVIFSKNFPCLISSVLESPKLAVNIWIGVISVAVQVDPFKINENILTRYYWLVGILYIPYILYYKQHIHDMIKIASMSIRGKFNGWWVTDDALRFSTQKVVRLNFNGWRKMTKIQIIATENFSISLLIADNNLAGPWRYNQLVAFSHQTIFSNIIITGVSFLQIDDNFSSIYEALYRPR